LRKFQKETDGDSLLKDDEIWIGSLHNLSPRRSKSFFIEIKTPSFSIKNNFRMWSINSIFISSISAVPNDLRSMKVRHVESDM